MRRRVRKETRRDIPPLHPNHVALRPLQRALTRSCLGARDGQPPASDL
jgi:hypothetical protein